MGEVIGLTVWVRLKPPSSTVVYGKVQSLVPNSHLTLREVLFPGSASLLESWTIQASAIENLEVVDPKNVPHPRHLPNAQQQTPQPTTHASPFQQQQPASHAAVQPQQHAHQAGVVSMQQQSRSFQSPAPPAAATPQRASSTLIDPAIISYGTSPGPKRDASAAPALETPIKSMLARAAQNLPSPGSPFVAEPGKANVAQKLAAVKQTSTAPPTQTNANQAQEHTQPVAALPQDGTQDDVGAKKKTRRGPKSKKMTPSPSQVSDHPPVMNVEVSRNGNDMNGAMKRGKGWRNTPLLQPSAHANAASDKANTKKSRHKRGEDQEFAQGDTTDIQDMGDFDFEGELKKFDKKSVFDEIRQGDTTADEDRLVSHNRIHRPGTHGGKNLHPTEPVLSPKLAPKYNSNEVDSASDADTEFNFANGRSSSRHSASRGGKAKPSRQNSGQLDTRPHPLTTSVSSDRGLKAANIALINRGGKSVPSMAATSPRPDREHSPHSAVSSAKANTRVPPTPQIVEPYFAILTSMAPCPTLLPRALETLEDVTVSTYGISHDAFTETAAKYIAEAALALADDVGLVRRPSRASTFRGSITNNPRSPSPADIPTIVVLAGNHTTGARALAAVRHLAGRSYNIIAAESLFETAETQDSHAKAQTAILRRMARSGASIKRGLWQKASGYIKSLTGPPVVIVDALLAGTTYDGLRSTNVEFSAEAQKEAREMIDWANRSRAPVLSVACPSGVSGIDGQATTVDGEPLAIRPDKVIALGAPMQGLLKASEHGERWDINLADIGVNIALKSDEAVAFGGPWVVDLKYVDDQTVEGTH